MALLGRGFGEALRNPSPTFTDLFPFTSACPQGSLMVRDGACYHADGRLPEMAPDAEEQIKKIVFVLVLCR